MQIISTIATLIFCIITAVFSVTWSFRNHSNMLTFKNIKNINNYYSSFWPVVSLSFNNDWWPVCYVLQKNIYIMKTYSKLLTFYFFKRLLLLYIVYDTNIYRNNTLLQGGFNTIIRQHEINNLAICSDTRSLIYNTQQSPSDTGKCFIMSLM